MWTKERIWEWYRQQPWMFGFNYVPSYAVNSTEMWQPESFDAAVIERELAAAATLGYNTCRVFMQYLLWKDNSEAFFACFDAFLAIAAKNGMRAMPILFDDCAFAGKEPYLGPQDDPLPGVHNSGWTPSPGFANADSEEEQPLLQAYVTEFVTRYGQDERIVLWDLYNEPGISDREEKSHALLKNAFAWARACNPSQPLTACVWNYKPYDMICPELSDIVSFHDYCDMEVTAQRVKMLEGYGRPLVCTEWLHRPNNNRFETHLAYYNEKNIGIMQWGMVIGKTQTYLHYDRSRNPKEGLPKLWQHDVFYSDLTLYSEEEAALIASVLQKE